MVNSPLDSVILSALEMGAELGLSADEVASRLTSRIEGKQNRYKWRLKVQELQSRKTISSGCKFTGNFIEDLGL